MRAWMGNFCYCSATSTKSSTAVEDVSKKTAAPLHMPISRTLQNCTLRLFSSRVWYFRKQSNEKSNTKRTKLVVVDGVNNIHCLHLPLSQSTLTTHDTWRRVKESTNNDTNNLFIVGRHESDFATNFFIETFLLYLFCFTKFVNPSAFAPRISPIFWPFLNAMNVGIAVTPYRWAVSLFRSTSTWKKDRRNKEWMGKERKRIVTFLPWRKRHQDCHEPIDETQEQSSYMAAKIVAN
jgi:hypothetical protein